MTSSLTRPIIQTMANTYLQETNKTTKTLTDKQQKFLDCLIEHNGNAKLAAKEAGFTLWDKVLNELNTPWGAVNWERNYMNRYVQKNYETNLVFCKF